jgi:hypothetical protein
MVAFQRDHRHSLAIRRSMGLTPFPRRRRHIAFRTPCGAMDVLSTTEPAAFLRSEAVRHFTIEGAPAYDDVQGVCNTLQVQTFTPRVMALVHDIASLLAELADARRALARK